MAEYLEAPEYFVGKLTRNYCCNLQATYSRTFLMDPFLRKIAISTQIQSFFEVYTLLLEQYREIYDFADAYFRKPNKQ